MIVRVGHHHRIGINLGNPKVATQMNKIEWTQIACYLNQIHVVRAAREHRDTIDIHAREMQP